jgi:hypothetical protein
MLRTASHSKLNGRSRSLHSPPLPPVPFILDRRVLRRQGSAVDEAASHSTPPLGSEEGPSCRNSRLFIIDWDDTINASSWCMKQGILTIRPPNRNDLQAVRELSAKAAATIQKCLEHGIVVIVTNAEAGWVECSARELMPDVARLLNRIPVISARTTFEHVCRSAPIVWKTMAFAKILTELRTPAMSPGLILPLEVISIGDSDHEREAVFKVCLVDRPSFIPKSIKLVDRPTVGDLTQQHHELVNFLDSFLSSNTPKDVYYEKARFIDYPEKPPGVKRPSSVTRDPRQVHTAFQTRPKYSRFHSPTRIHV